MKAKHSNEYSPKGELAVAPLPARQEFLTTRQLSEILQVSESTVRRLTREGRIPVIRLTKRLMRFDLPAVREALGHTTRPLKRNRRNVEDSDREQQQLFFTDEEEVSITALTDL